ncbi:MAG: hypothetical protein PHH21_00340 [Candidatus Pacebacteria bacterium]|nr:hypothetical protein [Candidatus Paceibacterota bacterium]
MSLHREKGHPLINTTFRELDLPDQKIMDLSDEKRKRIQALMFFKKAPERTEMIRRAKKIVRLIQQGLVDLSKTEEYPYGDCPENYAWSVIIEGAPAFFQRRVEDALLVCLFEPVYVVSPRELSWLYDDEAEWCERRNALIE